MRYELVSYPDDVAEFEDRVSTYLNVGWQLVGGVSVVAIPEGAEGPETIVFAQAMTHALSEPPYPVFDDEEQPEEEENAPALH